MQKPKGHSILAVQSLLVYVSILPMLHRSMTQAKLFPRNLSNLLNTMDSEWRWA